MPFACRNCSPVAAVASVNPRSYAVCDRSLKGKCGSSYIFRKAPTVFFINCCVRMGARPYFHSILAMVHQPLSLPMKTQSCPSYTPNVLGSSLIFDLSPWVASPNSRAAETRFLFTSTKIEAPSSTGSVGSPYTSTVVDLPPT